MTASYKLQWALKDSFWFHIAVLKLLANRGANAAGAPQTSIHVLMCGALVRHLALGCVLRTRDPAYLAFTNFIACIAIKIPQSKTRKQTHPFSLCTSFLISL